MRQSWPLYLLTQNIKNEGDSKEEHLFKSYASPPFANAVPGKEYDVIPRTSGCVTFRVSTRERETQGFGDNHCVCRLRH